MGQPVQPAVLESREPELRLYASYPAVPWACPETLSIEMAHAVPTHILAEVLNMLAVMPYAARQAAGDCLGHGDVPEPRDGR